MGNGPTGTRTPRTVAREDKHARARRAPSARARPRKTPLCPAAAAPESQREDNREPAQEGAGWAWCACAETAAACQATKGRAREGRARRCALQAADARHPSPHTPPHAGFWRKPALKRHGPAPEGGYLGLCPARAGPQQPMGGRRRVRLVKPQPRDNGGGGAGDGVNVTWGGEAGL